MNNNRYYEAPYDSYDEALEAEVEKLMKTPEFNAFDSMNIVEALGELSLKDHEDLQMCLDMRNFEMIGRKIWALTDAYLEKQARNCAESELS